MANIVYKTYVYSVLDFGLFGNLTYKWKKIVSIVCFAFHSSQTCAFFTLLICGRVERWINWCYVKPEIVTLNKVSHSWFDFASLWYYWTYIFILHIFCIWKLTLEVRLDSGLRLLIRILHRWYCGPHIVL